MSDEVKKERVFADGVWVKKHNFANGGSLLKLGVNAEKLIAWLNQHRNAKGWVNLVISENKTPSERSTHSCYLDDWVPKPRDDGAGAPASDVADNPDNLPF